MRKPICGCRSRTSRSGSVSGPGLAEDLLRDRELAEVVQAAGQARELDLLLVEPEACCDPRGELGHARRVATRVCVA